MNDMQCNIQLIIIFELFLKPGIFKHSQSVSRSYLAEVTPKVDQSGVLGTFNAASSMGFILGPMVGGRLAETSGGFYKVALACTVIFILNEGNLNFSVNGVNCLLGKSLQQLSVFPPKFF